MPTCPYCRIQVAGNTCPKCGRALVPPPPKRPQQPPMQRVAPAPPPPSQPPQYQQPAPQRPVAYQPVAQQPQVQPAYYQPVTPTAAPSAPPKKSKKGPVIAVVVVVLILVIALMAYLFVLKPGEDGNGGASTITYTELCNDLEFDMGTMTISFKSYDDGDVLNVVGSVENVRTANVPPGTSLVDSGPWTIVYFEEPGGTSFEIYNGFAYKGDLKSDYTVGEEGTITIHIEEMSAMGVSMEYPEEAMTTSMIESYMEVPNITLVFTQTSPGNYTGSITSTSDIMPLSDLNIEIYDASAGSTGWDDDDLTDDDPEEIDTWSSDLLLEFRDVNNNDLLDSVDTFTLSYAGTGDEITLEDDITWETITTYTIS